MTISTPEQPPTEFSLSSEHTPIPPKKTRFYLPKKYAAAIGIGVLGLGFVGIAATRSLPSSILYPIKTNVIEKSFTALHIHSREKANYQIVLLQTRLAEAIALAAADTVSDEAIARLQARTFAQRDTLFNIIETSIDSAYPKTDVLYTLNEFSSVATALEAVSEADPELTAFGDEAETIRQDTVRLYKDRVESFVATESPVTIYTYLTEQLQTVQTELNNPDVDKDTLRSAGNYLDRVEPAVGNNDLDKAILALGESYRIIKTAVYSGVPVAVATDITNETPAATTTEIVGSSTAASSTFE